MVNDFHSNKYSWMWQGQFQYYASSESKQLGASFHLCCTYCFLCYVYVWNWLKNLYLSRLVLLFFNWTIDFSNTEDKGVCRKLLCWYCFFHRLIVFQRIQVLFLLSGEENNVSQNWVRHWTRETGQNKKARHNDGSFFIR